MKRELENIQCPWCQSPLRYRKGEGSPLVSMLRKKLPILDCPECGKTYRADPFDAGGEFLVEVIEKVTE